MKKTNYLYMISILSLICPGCQNKVQQFEEKIASSKIEYSRSESGLSQSQILENGCSSLLYEITEIKTIGDHYKEVKAMNKDLYIVTLENGEKGLINRDGELLTVTSYQQIISDSDYGRITYKEGDLIPVCKENKWGYINTEGEVTIDFLYDQAKVFSEGYAVVGQQGKLGYINEKGEVVIPFRYKEASSFEGGQAEVEDEANYGEYIIGTDGKVIIPGYEDIGGLSEGIRAVMYGEGKIIYIDGKGNEIASGYTMTRDAFGRAQMPPCFSNGRAQVTGYDSDTFESYINTEGEIIYSTQYPGATYYEEANLVIVMKDGKYGLTTWEIEAQEIIPPVYDWLDGVSDGAIVARRNNTYGYLDYQGREIIPCIYEEAEPFQEGSAIVKREGSYGLINHKGMEIQPCIYDAIEQDEEGISYMRRGIVVGAVDSVGKLILPIIYEECTKVAEGIISVKQKNKQAYFDNEGNCIVPFYYNEIIPIDERYFLARLEKNYTILKINKIHREFTVENIEKSKQQQSIYTIEDTMMSSQKKDIICYRENKKYGYKLRQTGEIIVPAIYDWGWEVAEETLLVKLNDKWGYLDLQGKPITAFIYDDARVFKEGRAIVKKKDGYHYWRGSINKEGKEVIPCEYWNLEDCNEGMIAAEKGYDSECGYLSKEGEVVVPLVYSSVRSFYNGGGMVTERVDTNPGYNQVLYVLPTGELIDSGVGRKQNSRYYYFGEWPITNPFQEDLMKIGQGDSYTGKEKFNFINKKGRIVLTDYYDWCEYDETSKLFIMVNDEFDRDGNVYKKKYSIQKKEQIGGVPKVLEEYDYVGMSGQGRVAVLKQGKYGYLDREGNEVISCRYDDVGAFKQVGNKIVAKVNHNQQWGLIDREGNEILPMMYDAIYGYDEEEIVVRKGGEVEKITW